jgi:iron complex outermembrane receptor protein
LYFSRNTTPRINSVFFVCTALGILFLCCGFHAHAYGAELALQSPPMVATTSINSAAKHSVNSATDPIDFDVHSGKLSDALRELCQQASLQLLYEPSALQNKRSIQVKEKLTVEVALNKLLSGTDMDWHLINGKAVAISSKPKAMLASGSGQPAAQKNTDGEMTVLTDVDVTGQSPWWSGSGSSSVSGFTKPLIETPRSVSQVSSDAIDIFSLSAVEDLLRVVPGVFTTTRFGVQGAVDIRSVPADTYFRGMRRLTLQGHGRSVLAAMDSIEVVGGPASPLQGMGKIGGYVNFVPKSGRSKTGQYFNEAHGFSQVVAGEYNRREFSFGFGGPVDLASLAKEGGYYVYGLLEDSDSYTEAIPVKQKVLQAATSLDDILGSFRLETGISYQESRTSGALIGRLTQDLVSHGDYIGGSPLLNLDLNGNGVIGYLEMQTASPVNGKLTTSNQPLNQVFNWPTDAAGNPLSLNQFPKIAGIPQSL